MKNYEKILNQRKNLNLISDNFIYDSRVKYNNIERWRCINRMCTASGFINLDDVFIITKQHNHANEYQKIIKTQILNDIFAKIQVENKSNLSIITSATKSLEDEKIMLLPKLKSINDKITKIKNKNIQKLNFDFNYLPDSCKNDLNGNSFLRFDSGLDSNERFVIFYSEYFEKYISKISIILVDGTFWSVPRIFTQLSTFNLYLFGKSFPAIYILLSGKTESLYNKAFSELNKIIKINFNYLIIDFEVGLMNALYQIYPLAKIYGCSFHFGQCIWRNLQKFELSMSYLNNPEFNKIIRKILNLIFIPLDMIKEEFKRIIALFERHKSSETDNFILYFERMFIGKGNNLPVFNMKFWSCNERVKKNIPRTINSVEAWHRSLNFRCHIPHLNVGKYLEILKEENERARICIAQSRVSIPQTNQNLVKEMRLFIIVSNYEYYEGFEFYDALDLLLKWGLDKKFNKR